MTLRKMQHALMREGVDSTTCQQCADVMLLHQHCDSFTDKLTATQAAQMLWLIMICQDSAAVRTEALEIDSETMPHENGQEGRTTFLQFLTAVIDNPRLSTNIEQVEVNATARKVVVGIRDDDPIEFEPLGTSPYAHAPQGCVVVPGAFLRRMATASASHIWPLLTTN